MVCGCQWYYYCHCNQYPFPTSPSPSHMVAVKCLDSIPNSSFPDPSFSRHPLVSTVLYLTEETCPPHPELDSTQHQTQPTTKLHTQHSPSWLSLPDAHCDALAILTI